MNKKRTREIAKIVREHQELWNQGTWVDASNPSGLFDVADIRDYLEAIKLDLDPDTSLCGTTGCVAGWAAMLYAPAGSKLSAYSSSVELAPGFMFNGTVSPSIESFGQITLDLTGDQSDWLFSEYRTQEQVLWALENDNENWEPSQSPGYEDYGYEDYDDDDEYDDEDEDED